MLFNHRWILNTGEYRWILKQMSKVDMFFAVFLIRKLFSLNNRTNFEPIVLDMQNKRIRMYWDARLGKFRMTSGANHLKSENIYIYFAKALFTVNYENIEGVNANRKTWVMQTIIFKINRYSNLLSPAGCWEIFCHVYRGNDWFSGQRL